VAAGDDRVSQLHRNVSNQVNASPVHKGGKFVALNKVADAASKLSLRRGHTQAQETEIPSASEPLFKPLCRPRHSSSV
jgi:hypothetical protein